MANNLPALFLFIVLSTSKILTPGEIIIFPLTPKSTPRPDYCTGTSRMAFRANCSAQGHPQQSIDILFAANIALTILAGRGHYEFGIERVYLNFLVSVI